MDGITKALLIATKAHDSQRDKAGESYILHPIRLMLQFQDEALRQVALLHDVVEDSDITLDDLRKEGFSDEVIQGVESMTKRDGEAYEDYVERLLPNDLARAVKRADLNDNLGRAKQNHLVSQDKMKQYDWALKRLDAYENK